MNDTAGNRQCARCVMASASDPTMTFDKNGFCNYCTSALLLAPKVYFPNGQGERKLAQLIDTIKLSGRGRRYDCVMGVSGGLDSSYLAYLGASRWGLRILALHVDDGFDTEISQANVQRLVDATGIDLVRIRPDESQFNELVRAYMLAGVPNVAAPQDNILFAEIYRHMKKADMRHFLSGGNFALESILQAGNTHATGDVKNIKDINKKFGRMPIDKLHFESQWRRDLNQKVRGILSPRPLNYIDYNRDRAFAELAEFCGFEYYGQKHLENTLTKFVQVYWMYHRFGVDKRRAHFSSLIVTGQMSRPQALAQLEKPPYLEDDMARDIEFIKRKLDFDDEEWRRLMEGPARQHSTFAVSVYTRMRSRALQAWRGARASRAHQ